MTEELPQAPHDPAAELAAVGAAIQDARALAAVLEVAGPDRFYRPAHGWILTAAQAVADAGHPVDPVTVGAELDRRGLLSKVGGPRYLLDAMALAPTASAGHYAEIVAAKATIRDVAGAATRIHQLAQSTVDDPAALIERARAEFDAIAAGHRPGDDATWTAQQLADRAVARYANPLPPGIPTGWRDLDHVIRGGLRPGWLVIVGARPKVGKSMIGVSLPLHTAQTGHPAAIVSLEMPEAELSDRLVAQLSGVDLDALRECKLTHEQWAAVSDAADQLRPLPLTILDSKRQTLTSIRARVRDLQRGPGCELLVVDYLGLVTPADSRVNRQEQVAAISRGLKLIAGELNIPIIALAQINRGPEQRSDRRPLPSDLRESGAIEADADQVWLLHRDDERPYEIELNIALNRHGTSAGLALAWAPRLARVADLAKFDHPDRGVA